MFELKDKDYHLIFEYDTIEELEMALEKIKELKHIGQNQDREDRIRKHSSFRVENSIKFVDLEFQFIAQKKKIGGVSHSSYKSYSATFNYLKKYFHKRYINDISLEELEDFQNYLKEKEELTNKTINNHMHYVKMFYNFALKRNLIEFNTAEGIDDLRIPRTRKKENYSDEEILTILNESKGEEIYYYFFKIAIFTGMRFNEILNIKTENIKKTNGITYIDIMDSKTFSGIRKVPLHNELLDLDFSLFDGIYGSEKNKYSKRVLKKLYEIIPQGIGKTFHTFRGTFIQKLTNLYPDKIHIIQEIVGHSRGSKSITLDTYAKEFYLEEKLNLINNVKYQ
jgi:integrase